MLLEEGVRRCVCISSDVSLAY